MIKNLKGTADHISNWIKERAQASGAKTLVLGISGGVDSALVAALCARTGMPVIGVMMPCHSSPNSLERGKEVIEKFNLVSHKVELNAAFEAIASQIPRLPADTKAAHGALRSCLRAPTLDFVGKLYDGIIVGTGNRDEDEVTRYFQKRGDGCVDISPIAKLHKSEVYALSEYLGVPDSVLKATPSADLWGPDAGQEDEKQLGMTYKEVEWGIRAAESHGGTRGEHFRKALLNAIDDLGSRGKHILETLAGMEEASRHKENPALPVCDVREAQLGLVQ